jgi:hypothetical protein
MIEPFQIFNEHSTFIMDIFADYEMHLKRSRDFYYISHWL